MITAVDTNVLLDVLIPDAPRGDESERALAEAVRAGAVVISDLVYAELAAHFPDRAELDRFLADTGIRLEACGAQALHRAGRAWKEYVLRRPAPLACPQCGAAQDVRCERCGASVQPRQHVVADFVIGAHALAQADRLLTRDMGYYATYFPDLKLS
jgi:predicted nucleic acid-binding protein